MLLFALLLLTTTISFGEGRESRLHLLKNRAKCALHDLKDTRVHFDKKKPSIYRNRSIDVITQAWQETFAGSKFDNKKPFNQMDLRDRETILRMAEYQALIYCPNLLSISEMNKKNLRIGNFHLEAMGNDSTHHLFWYLASNDDQKQLTLVHRGTKVQNRDDLLTDLYPGRVGARHQDTFRLDFPYLVEDRTAIVAQGFHHRFKDQQQPIERAVEAALLKYPNYTLVIVGHSLGAAWAYLDAGYLAGKGTIPIAALYTFGQPLLGNSIFVDQLATKIGINKIIRVVNKNDIVPHIGCENCVQPSEPSEKWISMADQWIDCQGGHDIRCSSGLSCKELSWTEHSSVGKFSMRGEFCKIKTYI